MKDIDIHYHVIQSLLENGQLSLVNIHTNENLVDMLTETVPPDELKLCETSVGLHS